MWSFVCVLVIAAVGVRAEPTTNTGCICVHHKLCTRNNTIVDDGSGVLISGSRREFEECSCPVDGVPSRMDCIDRMHICCHVPEEEPETSSEEPELSWDDCGITWLNPRDAPGSVITNEETMHTFEGEFPWMALVIKKADNSMVCAGSILHRHVVMTAAHCVRYFQEHEVLVRVGVWDRENLKDSVTVEVERMFKQDEFGGANYRNDVALLVLQQGLQLSGAVAPICLPEPQASYANMLCWVTGWGTSQYQQRNSSRTLRKAEVKIVPRAQCQEQLRHSKLGPFFKVHESFVCAKDEKNTDTCVGDGGGPLVCRAPGSQRFVQVGIVAAGVGCGGDMPALYANVPHLMPWIQGKFDEWHLKSWED